MELHIEYIRIRMGFLTVLKSQGFFFFLFIFISWRLITLQYCSSFSHTLTWISLGYTCIPHPYPPSHLPPHPIPLGLPSAPALSTCLMHPAWAGDLFHPRQYTCFDAVLSKHPTVAFFWFCFELVFVLCYRTWHWYKALTDLYQKHWTQWVNIITVVIFEIIFLFLNLVCYDLIKIILKVWWYQTK